MKRSEGIAFYRDDYFEEFSDEEFIRLGFAGNHPLRTRSFCSITSLMLQNEENATTARIAERKTPFVNKANIDAMTPSMKKA